MAENEARKIGALINCGEFDWAPYLKASGTEPETCGSWVERFERDYFARRQRSPKSETTWKTDYLAIFAKLPASAALTADLIMATVTATQPDSKTRKRACMALGALAKFAAIDVDLKPMKGSYSPASVEPRDIPSDEAIAAWFYKIPNPEWQWVYGVLATYGIRPSEFIYCDMTEFPILTIADGKTGPSLRLP